MQDVFDTSAPLFKSLQRGDVVDGVVVKVDQDEVLVDVGLKSEGIVSGRELEEFTREGGPPLRVGDPVLVYVVHPENAEGYAVLSLRKARMEHYWRRAQQLFNAGEVIEVPVVDYNRGGLIVDLGVRGFVPISQVNALRREGGPRPESDDETLAKLATVVGKRLQLKVIELNRARNRLILSERAASQEERSRRKDALISELRVGDVRWGKVSGLCDFGAFVDLGGADGLVHVSQLSWNRVNHPSEVLRVGQEVEVSVVSIDNENKKIALSMKKARPDPWEHLQQRFAEGEVMPATVTKIAKFGAFARLANGMEGLIHISELADRAVGNPREVVAEGQKVRVRIISVDPERRRLGLSLRDVDQEEVLSEDAGEQQLDQPEPRLSEPGAQATPDNGNGQPAASPLEAIHLAQ